MPEYTPDQLLAAINASCTRPGDARVKLIAERVLGEVFKIFQEFDVTHEELWALNGWLNDLGKAHHAGLLTAGVGLERLIDIMNDAKDQQSGRKTGTPRAIEGPLFVPGAPQTVGVARLDDGTETGEPMVMEGIVRDVDGKPIAGAIVEVWQANTRGGYSFIDPSQAPYNFRRRIETDAEGRYKFRSLVPPGYAVPSDSPVQVVLDLVGRDGSRPAHIHFMVTAEGQETLTTQVNLPNAGGNYDDFAFGTREALIGSMKQVDDPAAIAKEGLDGPFQHIAFDLVMAPAKAMAGAR